MKTIRTLIMLLLAACLVAGCTGVKSVANRSGGPQAWFDAPLDGSALPLAQPYEIVFHISDLSGVMMGELSINGQVLEVMENPVAKQTLATLRKVWTPTEPGNYTIRARAQNGGGQWSEYAEAVVTVGGPIETPTPTQTPLTVTEITPITVTPSPTFTTAPQQPPPQPAELTFTSSVSTNQINYGGCGNDSVTISVQVSDPSVYSVVLFVRLLDAASGNMTEWSAYNAMSPTGGGVFRINVTATSIPGYNTYSSATLVYQFVATNASGDIVGRSPRIQDVGVSACGAPPGGITPVRPPVGETLEFSLFPTIDLQPVVTTPAPPVIK